MRPLYHNLSALLLLFALLSCSNDDNFRGSGNIISQSRNIASFSKIENSTSINITISEGSTQEVEVSADDNIINDVKTSVGNGVLKVDLSRGSYIDVTITISVTLANFEELQNTGSGSTTISGFEGLADLDINNEGSGSVLINGSGATLSIKNTGSGNYKGFGYVVQNCTVNNSGSGDCEINCTDVLNGSNSGSGSIFFQGNPSIDITNTGSGKVEDSN